MSDIRSAGVLDIVWSGSVGTLLSLQNVRSVTAARFGSFSINPDGTAGRSYVHSAVYLRHLSTVRSAHTA